MSCKVDTALQAEVLLGKKCVNYMTKGAWTYMNKLCLLSGVEMPMNFIPDKDSCVKLLASNWQLLSKLATELEYVK